MTDVPFAARKSRRVAAGLRRPVRPAGLPGVAVQRLPRGGAVLRRGLWPQGLQDLPDAGGYGQLPHRSGRRTHRQHRTCAGAGSTAGLAPVQDRLLGPRVPDLGRGPAGRGAVRGRLRKGRAGGAREGRGMPERGVPPQLRREGAQRDEPEIVGDTDPVSVRLGRGHRGEVDGVVS